MLKGTNWIRYSHAKFDDRSVFFLQIPENPLYLPQWQATKKKKRVSAVIQILLEISYSSPKTESETRKLKSTLETNIQIYELDSAERKPIG
jgi:hypothetical protein